MYPVVLSCGYRAAGSFRPMVDALQPRWAGLQYPQRERFAFSSAGKAKIYSINTSYL